MNGLVFINLSIVVRDTDVDVITPVAGRELCLRLDSVRVRFLLGVDDIPILDSTVRRSDRPCTVVPARTAGPGVGALNVGAGGTPTLQKMKGVGRLTIKCP